MVSYCIFPNLSCSFQAEKVTEHYPIEFSLQVTTEKPNSTVKTPQPEVTTTSGGSNLIIEISLGLLCMTLLLL